MRDRERGRGDRDRKTDRQGEKERGGERDREGERIRGVCKWVRGQNWEVYFWPSPCPAPSHSQGGGGPIVKIHPDSESTLLKTPHLIPHTMVEVNMGKAGVRS